MPPVSQSDGHVTCIPRSSRVEGGGGGKGGYSEAMSSSLGDRPNFERCDLFR